MKNVQNGPLHSEIYQVSLMNIISELWNRSVMIQMIFQVSNMCLR